MSRIPDTDPSSVRVHQRIGTFGNKIVLSRKSATTHESSSVDRCVEVHWLIDERSTLCDCKFIAASNYIRVGV